MLYLNALQRAYETAGHLPYELVYDKFPGHNSEQWHGVEINLEKAGVKITRTSSSTGKAQLERAFGTLQSVFMSDTIWYYGEGIRSTRRYAHRSEEYLKALRKQAKQSGWDWDKACDAMDGVIERYNTTPFNKYSKSIHIEKSPNELFAEDAKENVIKIEVWQACWMFNLRKTLQVNDGILRTEIMKQKVYYSIEDYSIIRKYKHVVLAYDLRDLSSALVYTESGELLCEAKELEPVQIYGKAAELGRLSHERAVAKRIAEQAEEELQAVHQLVADNVGDEVALLMPTGVSKEVLSKAEDSVIEAKKISIKDDEKDPDIDIKKMFYSNIGGSLK